MSRIINETPNDRLLKCLEDEYGTQTSYDLSDDPDFQEISKMSAAELEGELNGLDEDQIRSLERSRAAHGLTEDRPPKRVGAGSVMLNETARGGICSLRMAPAAYHYGIAAGIAACVALAFVSTGMQFYHKKSDDISKMRFENAIGSLSQKTDAMGEILDQQVITSARIEEKIASIAADIRESNATILKSASHIEEIGERLERTSTENEVKAYYKASYVLPPVAAILDAQPQQVKQHKLSLKQGIENSLDNEDTKLQMAVSSYYKNLFLSLSASRASLLAQTER